MPVSSDAPSCRLPHRTTLLLGLILCLGLAEAAGAQGFNAFSGRNHPELDWRVAETEHFEIMYPARLQGIEVEAAPIAEASYWALSHNLNVTFDEPIRIYLSDEDEIVNGFAAPIGNGYTNIWVHVNEFADVMTGREKWLRKVIAHELAHIFHYQAIRSTPRLLNFLLADPLPSFWTEGLAQYETELWDAQRGDRWLRTAVLDDQLSYEDGRSLWNGRLRYAVGNAQVRYFAAAYGDSTLAQLLHHRKPVLFGLARVHDFGTAFEAVTDQPYRRFYDDWRRVMNVYYNTMAGQMETPDSLDADPLGLPGQYLFDVQYSPDTTRVAVLSLPSLQRPVRRLLVVNRQTKAAETVAEGAIKMPVAWSPDGRYLAYARLTRGDYGSLLNDLYLVDAAGDEIRRLTHSRRATAPTFSPDGARLAFIASEDGTDNVYVLDLATGAETALTHFEGDVQLTGLRWHDGTDRLVFARFEQDGTRNLVILHPHTGDLDVVTAGTVDDRYPLWSPDGTRIAYTSLRDGVPNVFVYDLRTRAHHRVTFLVTGATAHDWLPPDSARAEGSLVVVSHVTKSGDRAYRIDAGRVAEAEPIQIPAGYAAWTTQRPPFEVDPLLPPAPGLITARHDYHAWRNLTHAASLALPYYGGPDDWGIFGMTTWLEPLAKHLLFVGGGLSFAAPVDQSYLLGSYVNNQWYPTLSLNLYRLPGSVRFYGSDLLVEHFTGGDLSVQWPLDWSDAPYTSTAFSARLRYADVAPLDADDFEADDDLPRPEAGQQADLQFALTWTKQRPYANNLVHPLDGLGLRARLTGAAPVLGGDTRFVRGDLAAYSILGGLGLQRLFLYGHAQAQAGDAFAQDFVGLARYDDVQLTLPGNVPFSLGEAERVRGYRSYALGNRLLFGTAEYRVPLLSSLQTRLLGLVTLGATTLAAFTDAALVWTDADLGDAVRRVGAGVELKNALRLGGIFQVAHALGVAQPAALGTRDDYEVYYRIRAAVPF